jgi:hypothetical protein
VGVSWVAWYLPDSRAILGEGCQLLLHPVHPVDAVDEQDQDEDEGDLEYVREDDINNDEVFFYLQAILELCDNRAFRDEGEQLALNGERQRDDEGQENRHLKHQEEEDLAITWSGCCIDKVRECFADLAAPGS